MNVQDNQKSHKQLSKVIMKQFNTYSYDKEHIYCLCYAFKTLRYELSKSFYMEIRKNECSPASIDSLGTERGYFNDKSEKALNDNAENVMGNLIKKLDENKEDKARIIKILNAGKNFNDIKNFIVYMLLRQDNVLKAIRNEVIDKSIQQKEYIGIVENVKLNNILGNISIGFIYNNTKLNFITNSCGYSTDFIIDTNNSISMNPFVIPLTPQIAIMIFYKLNKNSFFYMEESNRNNILKINKAIIKHEEENNNNFIIAKEKMDIVESLK